MNVGGSRAIQPFFSASDFMTFVCSRSLGGEKRMGMFWWLQASAQTQNLGASLTWKQEFTVSLQKHKKNIYKNNAIRKGKKATDRDEGLKQEPYAIEHSSISERFLYLYAIHVNEWTHGFYELTCCLRWHNKVLVVTACKTIIRPVISRKLKN